MKPYIHRASLNKLSMVCHHSHSNTYKVVKSKDCNTGPQAYSGRHYNALLKAMMNVCNYSYERGTKEAWCNLHTASVALGSNLLQCSSKHWHTYSGSLSALVHWQLRQARQHPRQPLHTRSLRVLQCQKLNPYCWRSRLLTSILS